MSAPIGYRAYIAPEGCALTYLGERETLAEAQALAASATGGLEQSLWDTARAAGHCDGMSAPGDGVEDDEPISWHGDSGDRCVVAVREA